MDLDLFLMTVASAGLWLLGCGAFISAAQEWAHDRADKLNRRRQLSKLCD